MNYLVGLQAMSSPDGFKNQFGLLVGLPGHFIKH